MLTTANRVALLVLPGVLILPLACNLLLGALPGRGGSTPPPSTLARPRPRRLPQLAAPPASLPAPPPAVVLPRVPASPAPAVASTSRDDPEPARGGAPTTIPGVEGPALVRALEASHFACSPVSYRQPGVAWSCSHESAARGYSVSLQGATTSEMRSITASVAQYAEANDMVASMFLGSLAALAYSGAEPARATQWVSSTIASGGSVTIGAVRFELSGVARLRTLEIRAVGLQP